MSDWKNIPPDINEYVGFVYIIINKTNFKYYIGQKKFWNKKKLKPLKGKKRNRYKRIESDWKSYYGSCKELLKDIELLGKKEFSRSIIRCYTKKALMNYYETMAQFDKDVLFDPKSYNRIINCRISSNQIGGKK